MLYFFMVADKVACQTLSKASLKSIKSCRGLAGVGDFSHRGFLSWRSALWCSFLLWSLPVLQRRSSPLAVSVCSNMTFSVTLLAWIADEVVLAPLQVAFLGKCDDKELGPQGWPFSCLSDFVADCRNSREYWFSTCLDQFCRMLSISADFFFQWLYCSPHIFAKVGVVVLCVWGQLSTDGSPLVL